MKATKHYEHGHVIVYINEDGLQTCLTFDDERQMARAGECLRDLARIGGETVEIVKKPKE